jgi:hypothetical protein
VGLANCSRTLKLITQHRIRRCDHQARLSASESDSICESVSIDHLLIFSPKRRLKVQGRGERFTPSDFIAAYPVGKRIVRAIVSLIKRIVVGW